jgi:hypothetical protein
MIPEPGNGGKSAKNARKRIGELKENQFLTRVFQPAPE